MSSMDDFENTDQLFCNVKNFSILIALLNDFQILVKIVLILGYYVIATHLDFLGFSIEILKYQHAVVDDPWNAEL